MSPATRTTAWRAGSRTAACWCVSPARGSPASDDDLVPVKLRRGGRILGGSLSWDKPQPLAGFSRESPFNGMTVPNDVTVTRQVLAEPDATLTDNTWATLADGTPLVTAARRGKGLIVLFHVTGDTRWSDLPLSGAFVDMLRRIVALAGTTSVTDAAKAETKSVREVGAAEPRARRLRQFHRAAADRAAGAGGLFRQAPRPIIRRASTAPPEGLLAVNTLAPADRLAPLDFAPLANARHEIYRISEPQDLRGPILLAALALFLLDTLVVLFLGGGIQRLDAALLARRGRRRDSLRGSGADARRQARAEDIRVGNVPASALETKLAYVVTGNAEVDNISKAGLAGLTLFLAQRTALEPGDPIGLDIAHDELAFYPLIYWPIVPGAARPSRSRAQAHRHLHEGRRHGAVRHPRRRGRAARSGRRDAQPRHAGTAQNPVLARSCPSSSRCRAITC